MHGDDDPAPKWAAPSPTTRSPAPEPDRPPRVRRPMEPELPDADRASTIAPAPRPASPSSPETDSRVWYRSEQERARSVRRRANPWYRRLARGIIGISLLGLVAVGLYLGARLVQDWVGGDDLPAADPEVPTVRATSFQLTGRNPAPAVDGTLTLDTETGAYEYTGRSGGPHAGVQVVSPDGNVVYARRNGSEWLIGDALGAEVDQAVEFVRRADTADIVLTPPVRSDFVVLRVQETEGEEATRLERYELEIDTRSLATDDPLQWESFRQTAIPGARETPALPVTLWVDTSGVLTRLRAGATDEEFWSWQRLTYSDEAFTPVDPSTDTSADVVDAALGLLPCSPPAGLTFFTEYPNCSEAIVDGRALAVVAGLASGDDDAAADLAFTTVCRAIQNRQAVRTALLPASVELARQLHADGVCPGDLARLDDPDGDS